MSRVLGRRAGFVRGRVIAAGAIVHGTLLAGSAIPQTVIVTRVAPGTSVELLVNRTGVGTATAGDERRVQFQVALADRIGKPEIAARLLVDTCPQGLRIVLVERGVTEQPPGECTRRELVGVYLVRDVTTLLVSLSDPVPSVRIRQGPVPEAWLVAEALGAPIAVRVVRAPTGVMLAGTGNLAAFRRFGPVQCGDVAECAAKATRLAYAGSVSVWPWPWLGASATYFRPGRATARGSGTGYEFNAGLEAHLVAVTARVGGPAGRVRPFGQGGVIYHRARATISETVEAESAPGDGTITIEGGRQMFQTDTAGWGWMVGGGIEIWLSPSVGLVAGLDRAAIRGAALDGSEARLDEAVFLVTVGLQLRLGG